MPDDDPAASLRVAERRLQAAQLASDVTALDGLVDDDARYVGPDGAVLRKRDDLDAHRSGAQVLYRVDELDLQVRVVGSTGLTWVLLELEGAVGGEPFAARVRYTRTWTDDDRGGWRVVAAQATVLGGT